MVEGLPEPPYPVGGLNFPLTDSVSLSLPLCKADAVERLPCGAAREILCGNSDKNLQRALVSSKGLNILHLLHTVRTSLPQGERGRGCAGRGDSTGVVKWLPGS